MLYDTKENTLLLDRGQSFAYFCKKVYKKLGKILS